MYLFEVSVLLRHNIASQVERSPKFLYNYFVSKRKKMVISLRSLIVYQGKGKIKLSL